MIGILIASSLIGSRALSQLHPGCTGIIWLLTSYWSNLVRHLLPYLQDDQKAADYLRQLTAALQLCTLRCALGPAVCHVHGLDQFDLRREQVASPRLVVVYPSTAD